jgi:hypothetical protein
LTLIDIKLQKNTRNNEKNSLEPICDKIILHLLEQKYVKSEILKSEMWELYSVIQNVRKYLQNKSNGLYATSMLIQLEEQRCIYKIKNIVRQIK